MSDESGGATLTAGKLTERLLSLDAFRGLIMAALICNGLGLAVFKDHATWGWLAQQVDHVKWEGCVFWDLIQPSFMFMVGVSMPFAYAWSEPLGLWGNVLQATLVLAAQWGVLLWLYRRKIFFKL